MLKTWRHMSYLTEKLIAVIKLLNKLRIMMSTPNENINKEKENIKRIKTKFTAQEYKNCIEKFTRGQHLKWSS